MRRLCKRVVCWQVAATATACCEQTVRVHSASTCVLGCHAPAHHTPLLLCAQAEIGRFPLIIRPAFTLGGTGGGIAYNMEEFKEIVQVRGRGRAAYDWHVRRIITTRACMAVQQVP